MRTFTIAAVLSFTVTAQAQDSLPFSHTVETFQHEEDDIRAFVIRLEQPFLAEEFEQSNYLRLKSLDDNSFLLYPRETRFQQKHAEFYGRLKGSGDAKLRLSYEIVSENPDGSRRMDSRQADVVVPVPAEPTGSDAVYRTWAEYQNRHFADLLQNYPGESFFEYLLLQSKERYGVSPPSLSSLMPDQEATEEGMYRLFSSGIVQQRSVQRTTLRGKVQQGDPEHHVSQLDTPSIRSLDYEELLRIQQEEHGRSPAPQAVAVLVPANQYLLQFDSWQAANRVYETFERQLEPVYRMLAEDARDHHLREKYERQLGLTFASLEALFADGSVTEMALTGSDFFVGEGTDLTVLLKTSNDSAAKLLANRLTNPRSHVDGLEDRTFNYRGVRITARYTNNRVISSFAVQHEGWLIVANSHVAIRRVVDTIQQQSPSLAEAHDYRLMTALHPPANDDDGGYFYCSDAFLRYLVSPQFKIGQRRRRQSLNNLIMVNNASLFYRLEYGQTPQGLGELTTGRFIDADRLVCPQGGAYAFNPDSDTSTNSVFNRIRYLTPIRELKVLRVSDHERSEYDRYRTRYESWWKQYFTPLALRISANDDLRIEYCLLPFADGATRRFFEQAGDDDTRPLKLATQPGSVIASATMQGGRQQIGDLLRSLPGVTQVLADDPTLTDLNWLGDRLAVSFCDTHTVLEVDPTRLRALTFPFPLQVTHQAVIGAAAFAAAAPVYFDIEIADQAKADRFLEMLSSRIFLYQESLGEIDTAIDSYQLPGHRDHNVYVVSYRAYAARVRLYITAVTGSLVASTDPDILRSVIDSALDNPDARDIEGQFALRVIPSSMKKLENDIRIYWEERSRRASHNNIMAIYTLVKLYGVDISEVDALSDAKYGVTYFCPDGEYEYDAERDQVSSTAYGNRENARQDVPGNRESQFERFFSGLDELLLTVDISPDAVRGQLEIRGVKP